MSCCHPFQIISSFGGSGKYAHLLTLSCGINPHCDISVHEPPHLYPQHTFCPNVPSFVIVFATNKTNTIGSGGVFASYHVIMCLPSLPLLNLSTQCLCCAMPCVFLPLLCRAKLCLCVSFRYCAMPRLALAMLLATKPLPCVSSLCPSKAYLCCAEPLQLQATRFHATPLHCLAGHIIAMLCLCLACHIVTTLCLCTSLPVKSLLCPCLLDFFPREPTFSAVAPLSDAAETSVVEPFSDGLFVGVHKHDDCEFDLCARGYFFTSRK